MSPLLPLADQAAQAALAGTGLQPFGAVHANLTAPSLVTHALRRGEGTLSSDGALIVNTGVHTGRSVQDKFTVDDLDISAHVWWRMGNQKLAPASFQTLRGRILAYLQGRELFTQDLYAGADPEYRVRVRLVSTEAWHTLFARNMFIRPPVEELTSFEPDWVILHAPTSRPTPPSTACAPAPPSPPRSLSASSASPAASMAARSRSRSSA